MVADQTSNDGGSGRKQSVGSDTHGTRDPSPDPDTGTSNSTPTWSTFEAAAASTATHPPPAIGEQPHARTRRNPKWIALGILAICLGGLGSFFLYSHVTDAHQVVALTKTVHRGEKISSGDLTTVQVGNTSGVATVSSQRLSSMVGQVASYDLVKGALLSPASVGSEQPPGAGHGVIGIKVSEGRAPDGYLQPNTSVRLVVLPGHGMPSGSGQGHSASDSSHSSNTKDQSTGGGTSDGKQNGSGNSKSMPVMSAKVLNTSRVDGGMFLNVELKTKHAIRAASYAAQDRVAVVRDSGH